MPVSSPTTLTTVEESDSLAFGVKTTVNEAGPTKVPASSPIKRGAHRQIR